MSATKKPQASGKALTKARGLLAFAEERARQAADWVE